MRPAWCRLVVVALWSAAAAASAQTPKPDSLRITFFDVGQGDAALIQTPNGKNVLIDAGPGGAQIVPQLKALGVATIDLAVSTHNHADHVGGMADVFAEFEVHEYMDNGLPALTRAYRRLVDAVEAEKGLRVRAATFRDYRLGNVTLSVMMPPHAANAETQNDNSIGIWLKHGDFNAVFTGDAEENELTVWLSWYKFPRASVVKSSHHGSKNGVTEAWMDALSPKTVVISVGANNQYGHPSNEVLLGWASRGSRVYRTDAVGTVTITAAPDGGFAVRTSSGDMSWVSK